MSLILHAGAFAFLARPCLDAHPTASAIAAPEAPVDLSVIAARIVPTPPPAPVSPPGPAPAGSPSRRDDIRRDRAAVAAETAAAPPAAEADAPMAAPAPAAAPPPPVDSDRSEAAPQVSLAAIEVAASPDPAVVGAAEGATAPGGGAGAATSGPSTARSAAPGTRRRRRALELFGRVAGGARGCSVAAHADRPCVSLRESTALRAYDHFPRLPAALWTEQRPYIVRVELCVSSDGAVDDVALLSSESERLDPVVLEAVRGWRYRPRLVGGGRATAFCHGVIIQYDAL